MIRNWRCWALAGLAALVATEAKAQTAAGLSLADRYYLYFSTQSSYRQVQKAQTEQQRAIAGLRTAQGPLSPQYSAVRGPAAVVPGADEADANRSPQLTGRPLPAIYGGSGGTRQYFLQRRNYFNPR